MGLVANAHPSSAKCELIAGNEYVSVIAKALIGQCFFGRIKLIPDMADKHCNASYPLPVRQASDFPSDSQSPTTPLPFG